MITKPRHFEKKNRAIEIVTGLLIALFLFTGINQLTDLQAFREGLASSIELYPYRNILSLTIPAIGLTAAMLLFFPATRKAGLFVSASLLFIFDSYIAYMLFFVKYRPCTCIGFIPSLTWMQHFIINLFVLFLAITALWLIYRQQNIGLIPVYSLPPSDNQESAENL